MKAIAYLVDNFEEIVQAEKLSLPNPEKPRFVEREFYFVLGAVSFAFLIEEEGEKKIKIFISGQCILLKYDYFVWSLITNHLLKV